MLGKPGRYLLLMTFWWIAPFLVVGLADFSPEHWPLSYVPFLVALAVTLPLCALCNRLERRQGALRRSGFWTRYFLLNAWYTLNMVLILTITLTLDNYRLVRYFGGDAGGSFGMIYIPSILFYLVGGLVLGLVRQVRKTRQGRVG
jgi:hypothetical protein